MPTEHPWLTFSKWNKTYVGGLIFLDIMGSPFITINSAEIARDLLDKRSAIYSDRPVSVRVFPYASSRHIARTNAESRQQRRIVAQDLTHGKLQRYYFLQEREAAALVQDLIRGGPGALRQRIQIHTGAIILRVAYGYHITSADDKMLTEPVVMMHNVGHTTTPGNYLVDAIPALKYLPRWMPGSGFLRRADEWREQ
ncbi:cytochrome P450 [Pholiota molesta]|nr:cytochrome P450 [Pholiota molesta]